ncbi:hypothetical protein B9Q01_08000 [Candidatus Marsarchaeota G1 archaeon OSP_D]|jgi:acetolactate synthase-1/2/3 large subunit|uniref:Acetolactate synthase n=3 Tax=Candidatus Marsarchaeota group 1 TaxID=2203770 RepID=A0A2R6AH85_9ARCH|nr:MAG: hypothetical protein B9Q01_08000 [Candidatus Marsarchaeota G1 archaeon OSP_D]PSN85624.1 MAG: hypothetical protein B9Q00_10860 [Candidatus Marsarchaeota G1 archaeon OSP_C]PSN85740.1 MAG: hypothetical protein B9Q02_05075 [Candidatus Marsarchaeota G1 archaeon BE_D]
MKATRALLELLKEYSVTHVFGLVGETTLPLYDEWVDFESVKNVMCRDERNAVFMADGYARACFKPGVCEAPGPGASYTLPGLTEAYASKIPLVIFTSDISHSQEKRNMLTEYEKELMFRGVTKESITIHDAKELPRLVRRAFRLATTGVPGPVHVRIPMDVWSGDVEEKEVYAQRLFVAYPAVRFSCSEELIAQALKLLSDAQNPVIICGQGVILSQAWEEVLTLAESLAIPVATTITGKGAFPEHHPLSLGVVGNRGGTTFSNNFLEEADVVFYIGSNIDFSVSNDWTLPQIENKKLIQLNVSEADLGNTYRCDVALLGDAKAILQKMISMVKHKSERLDSLTKRLNSLRSSYLEHLDSLVERDTRFVDPYLFVKALEKANEKQWIIVADPGIGAIYTSAYYRTRSAGRKFIYNYSVGGLGFAVPAAIGAHFGTRQRVIALTTDGSLGFNVGEWETIARTQADVKVVVFNNGAFGWIRATQLELYGKRFFNTDFSKVDYVKVAEGFGLAAERLSATENLEERIKEFLNADTACVLEIPCLPEDKLLPPVPKWRDAAQKYGIRHYE